MTTSVQLSNRLTEIMRSRLPPHLQLVEASRQSQLAEASQARLGAACPVVHTL